MSNAHLSRGAFARLALVVATVALMASRTRAHELHVKPACAMTYEQVTRIGRSIAAANPQATFTDYAGAEAGKLVDKINSVEPVSHWTADSVVVIDPAGNEAFRVGLVEKDCVTRAFPVPREIWPGIVREALGLTS